MSLLDLNFNVNDLPEETQGTFEPLPAGDYNVTISNADLMTTKSGTGSYIKMRLTVTGPTHEGRILFANLNIKNDSQKAEEIGRQQLGSVMRAIGLANLSDTDQLIGGQMSVKVSIRKSEEWGDQNDVKSYKAIAGSAAPAFAAPQPQSGAAPASSGPAWARK